MALARGKKLVGESWHVTGKKPLEVLKRKYQNARMRRIVLGSGYRTGWSEKRLEISLRSLLHDRLLEYWM